MKTTGFAPLAAALAVLLALAGCSAGGTDTMSASISWLSGNCDLGIREPDGREFWVTDGSSPNGVFSADRDNGGEEDWVLSTKHDPGIYVPMARSISYSGALTFTSVVNGEEASITVDISPGETIVSSDLFLRR